MLSGDQSLTSDRRTRHSTRMRTTVEVLDGRRLLAAGVTAIPHAISGIAEIPRLRFSVSALAATDQTSVTIAAALPTVTLKTITGITGTRVNPEPPLSKPLFPYYPLITVTGVDTDRLKKGITAQIDWGDGSAIDIASFPGSTSLESQLADVRVGGPPHTYANAGVYTISVKFQGLSDPEITSQTTATIAQGPPTARPVSVSGSAGSPVNSPFANPGPFDPAMNLVPLLNLDGNAASLPINGVTATIDWGDGSALDAAILFGTLGIEDSSRGLAIYGPQHVYASRGTYFVNITVTGLNHPTAIYQTIATITPAADLAISGHLNPFSDSGISTSDGITNVVLPSFIGTTEPGSRVVLYATSAAHPNFTIPVGVGMADSAGRWSLTTVPFLDGSYTIVATTSNLAGTTASQTLAPLVIDSAGPTILSARVTNVRTGAFAIRFSDPYGLVTSPLLDPDTYVVTRTTPHPRRGQTFTVTNLTVSPASIGSTSISPVLVTGRLMTSKTPLSRNGVYHLTIRSHAIQSLAGTPLDGEYTGQFPTGNGLMGGDFQTRVTIRNGRASRPLRQVQATHRHASPAMTLNA